MKNKLSDNTSTLQQVSYTSLSPTMALQLAAPHTWPAAILPVFLGVACAVQLTGQVSFTLSMALLVICILMQAAVNTINDYYDFIKGTDSIENQDDPTDAVLVYNNINPRSAFYLALAFLGCALVLGIYVIYSSGWIPLAIGIIGALVILFYSAGKSPISYLPIGEYISGITMGGLITLASFYALTKSFNMIILVISIPIIIGIGLIMFTNNTCDTDKDIAAGRKTQSVLLGHYKAKIAYRATLLIWLACIVIMVAVFFTSGLIVIPFMLLILYPSLKALYNNPLIPKTRGQAMGQCLNINIGLGIFYVSAILFDASGIIVF